MTTLPAIPPFMDDDEAHVLPARAAKPVDNSTIQPLSSLLDPGVNYPDWLQSLLADAELDLPAPAAVEPPVEPPAAPPQPPPAVPAPAAQGVVESLPVVPPDAVLPVATVEEVLPDWLPPDLATPGAPDKNLPDWLQPESPAVSAGAWMQNLPDWLRGDTGQLAPVSVDNTPQDGLDWFPDWLNDAEGTPDRSVSTKPVEDVMALPAPAAPPPNAVPAAEPPAPATPPAELRSELPSFLRDLEEDDFLTTSSESNRLPPWLLPAEAQAETRDSDLPPWIRPTITDDINWLNSLGVPGLPPIRTPALAVRVEDVDFLISPRENRGLTTETLRPAPSEPATIASPVAPDDIPAWLDSAKPLQADHQDVGAAHESQTTSAAVEPLATPLGVLPAWLESLRPSDKASAPARPIAPNATDDDMLQQPPLSPTDAMAASVEHVSESVVVPDGLRIAPVIAATSKRPLRPAATPDLLTVTALQQAQSQLWQGLLQPVIIAPAVQPQAQRLWQFLRRHFIAIERVAVALILLVGMGLAFRFQPLLLSLPDSTDLPGAVTVTEAIQALPPGSEALLVADYSLGNAAELSPSVQLVAGQLVRQHVPLGLVSTNPSGALLLKQLLQSTIRDSAVTDYQYGLNYTNLGYLPGGLAGIQAFLTDPQNTVPLEFVDGTPAWFGALEGVQHSTDFELVVLAVADPDQARLWLEQLGINQQPGLSNSTLARNVVLIVPSGTEPVVLPYTQTAYTPVIGVLPGKLGAAALAVAQHLPEHASLRQWRVYGSGVLLTVLLLLIGNLLGWLRMALPGLVKKSP